MPDPFISRQDVTDYLGRDVTVDPGALAVVDAACEICREVAEQEFTYGTATISLDGSGTDCLILPERPVATAGSISVNGEDVTDYQVTAEGKLLRGSAGGLPRPIWPAGRQNITVTYEHGFGTADIPRSVCMVALQLASRMIIQGVAGTENLGEVSLTYSTPVADNLTENELRILRKYRGTRSF